MWPYDGEPNMEGMKHNFGSTMTNRAKAPVPDVSKFAR